MTKPYDEQAGWHVLLLKAVWAGLTSWATFSKPPAKK